VTRRALGLAIAGAVAATAAVVAAQSPPQTPQAVFRSATDLVTVPVFVKGSRDVVMALRAGDFALTDNGVPQKIESIETEALPVDVTVIVEASRAMTGYEGLLREQVRKIAALVRPTDRLEVLGIGDYVNVIVPLAPAGKTKDIPTLVFDGIASVNDALVAALLRQPDPDRRHLIIALTDTVDTMSATSMGTVKNVAAQSSATLVIAWITMSQDGDPRPGVPWATVSERLSRHVRAPTTLFPLPMLNIPGPLATPRSSSVIVGRTVPPRQQWTPHYLPPRGRPWEAFDLLRDAADMTGGELHPPGLFTDRNAAVIFDKIYAEFRQNVVLKYFPEGVTSLGWHEVKVTVPSRSGLELRPRRGYLVEATPTPMVPAPTEPDPGALASVRRAVDSGDFASVQDAIRAVVNAGKLSELIDEFDAAGNLWPASPRREFVTALLLADAAAQSPLETIRPAAVKLLETRARFVRPPTGPDRFSRDWMAAANLVLAAANRPELDRLLEALFRELNVRER
jgi:hypothetical protein